MGLPSGAKEAVMPSHSPDTDAAKLAQVSSAAAAAAATAAAVVASVATVLLEAAAALQLLAALIRRTAACGPLWGRGEAAGAWADM